MTTTTAVRADGLVAATVPYALFGLAQHLIDFELPAPLDVEVPGHAGKPITLWVRPEHAAAWTTTGITVDGSATKHDAIVGTRHTIRGTIHGACLPVRIIWTVPTLLDHELCTGDGGTCGRTVCFCIGRETLGPCLGTVARGCPHLAEVLCDEHHLQCSECRQDARDDAGCDR